MTTLKLKVLSIVFKIILFVHRRTRKRGTKKNND